MARVTVVIPSYNRRDYLAECLQSLAAQTFRDFDVVVLDNASTQDYGPVLAQFESMDIEYIRNETNIAATGNIEKAREIGARSEFHIVFHDDDLMHPELLEAQVRALDGNEAAVWVATECQPFDGQDDVQAHDWPVLTGLVETYDTAQLVRRILQNTALHFGSTMYRSAKCTGAHFRLVEFEIIADRVLLCDLSLRGPVCVIPQPLVMYRHHAAQDSHNPIFREAHALALMHYYRSLLPHPLSGVDSSLMRSHATNYLLHARAAVAPENRMPFGDLLADARDDELFTWSAINGQGVEGLARMTGLGSAYDAVRPVLRRAKRALGRG